MSSRQEEKERRRREREERQQAEAGKVANKRRLQLVAGGVIGHDRDPVHPFSDSDALVEELPNARLLRADSLLELRLTPERLTGEISGFLDECWRPRRKAGARRAAGVA